MACNVTFLKAEDAAIPRGDTEDTEVYRRAFLSEIIIQTGNGQNKIFLLMCVRKHGEENSACELLDPEKVKTAKGVVYVRLLSSLQYTQLS